MSRTLTCIICPRGCTLEVDDKLAVVGNACPRGVTYAVDECTHPMRTVTSTVRVGNRVDCMVSVKTATPIAKENIEKVMRVLRETVVSAPIRLGDVLIEDCYASAIVATKTIE